LGVVHKAFPVLVVKRKADKPDNLA
jgi:hypothetical protein